MTQIVAALSLKGGVGKTSVVLGLAGAAVQRGIRTLVVDLDPQANATASLDPTRTPYTTSDVLFDARVGVAADAVVPSGWSPLVSLIGAEWALEHRTAPAGAESSLRLRRTLTGVTDPFDLVLIDCPPSLGELTRNALYASNRALIVTEPSFFAVSGAEQALEAVSVVQSKGNPQLRPSGIVVNRMRPTLEEHRYRLDELKAGFGDLVLGTLPDRSAVQQAQGACVSVQQWNSNGSKDVSLAFDALLGRLLELPASVASATEPRPALVSTAPTSAAKDF